MDILFQDIILYINERVLIIEFTFSNRAVNNKHVSLVQQVRNPLVPRLDNLVALPITSLNSSSRLESG